MSKIIIPKPSASELALVSLIAGEHLLIEDIPGTGKTYLANNLSQLSKLKSNRIQCTNDLMPSDVIGYNKSISSKSILKFSIHLFLKGVKTEYGFPSPVLNVPGGKST